MRWINALLTSPIWVTIALAASTATGQSSLRPQFECGEYLVHGLLLMNGTHQFVLKMRDRSSAPYELLLGGGEVRQLLQNEGTHVELKVRVTAPIRDNTHTLVVLESLRQTETFRGEKLKVRPLACVR